MSNVGRDRAGHVFNEVADLPVEQQDAFLDQACGGDSALRAEVESLVAADLRAERFRPPRASAPGKPSVGTVIGIFTLVELIGEGGFGHVWRAEQTHPIRREVALKLLRPEVSSPQV